MNEAAALSIIFGSFLSIPAMVFFVSALELGELSLGTTYRLHIIITMLDEVEAPIMRARWPNTFPAQGSHSP